VKNARLAIEAGDSKAVGQLMDLNQMLLSGLFVSTPEIEQMCGTARAAGAFGAKLTGAGGGGSVVALVESTAVGAKVVDAWKKDGFDGFVTTASADAAQARIVASIPWDGLEGSP
jgi:mevalonate kinase